MAANFNVVSVVTLEMSDEHGVISFFCGEGLRVQ